jgi:TolB-like protein
LPFVNASGDPEMEYLSDGIAENLINGLSQLSDLHVAARTLAFRYRSQGADSRKAGRELNVRAVLTGRVIERRDVLNVQAELTSVDDGSQLWGRQYNRKPSDILAIQEEIVKEVSQKLRLRPRVEEQNRLAKRFTENSEAYDLYIKGRYCWSRRSAETLRRAVEYFEQAIAKDPHYALLYAGLADCYIIYGGYGVESPREAGPRAQAAATKRLKSTTPSRRRTPPEG